MERNPASTSSGPPENLDMGLSGTRVETHFDTGRGGPDRLPVVAEIVSTKTKTGRPRPLDPQKLESPTCRRSFQEYPDGTPQTLGPGAQPTFTRNAR
eukprot:9124069-Pyramimonas_sp.AAC.1